MPKRNGERAMTAPILVAYATKYGSTQEVADAIATTLREHGLDADAKSMKEIQSLEGRRAVVLGAPIYMGRWHGDVRLFLTRHRQALADLPVAIFALGPLNSEADEVRGARAQLDQELGHYPWLTPIAVEMFGGKYDPSRLSFAHRMIAALPASPLHGRPASDVRDWATIRDWAGTIGASFQADAPRAAI